jgi:hypothetical protein
MRALLIAALALAGCVQKHRFEGDGGSGVPADAGPPADADPAAYAPVVTIAGGTFGQGANATDETLLTGDALPYRQTYLSTYQVEVDRVTQARYDLCIAAQACDVQQVDRLTLAQAERFCAWLGMRLPTEAEWERAARGDQGAQFPWGDDPSGGTADTPSPHGVRQTFGLPDGEWVGTRYAARDHFLQPWADPARTMGPELMRGLGPAVWARVEGVTPGAGTGFRCARSIDDGEVPEPPAPVPCSPEAACATVELAAGRTHTCARRAGGDVVCWGNNLRGQLGTGDRFTIRGTPFWPVPVAAQDLAVGDDFTCALAGVALCWGANDLAQLGAPGPDSLEPVDRTELGPLTRIGAARAHACAIQVSGDVTCWGADDFNLAGTSQPGPTRLAVTGLLGATELAVGEQTLCGLVAGEARCVGVVPEGAGLVVAPVDAPRTFAVTGQPFVQLAAGARHACGLTATGALYCWGDGTSGQLGGAPAVHATPVQLVGGVAAMTLRGDATLAVDASGGTAIAFNLPDVPPTALLPPPLALGTGHVCALIGAEPSCFGDDRFGQAPATAELP